MTGSLTTRLRRATAAAVAILLLGSLAACGVRDAGTGAMSTGPESVSSAGMPPASPQVAPDAMPPVASPEAAAKDGHSLGYTGSPDAAQDAARSLGGVPPVPGGSGADASKISADQRLIIRDRSVSLRVKDVPAAVTRIRELAARDKGIVQQVQLASDDGRPVYRLEGPGAVGEGKPLAGFITVRVPAARYAAFVSAVGKLGTVLSETESAEDVTQQHVDLSARLKNLRAEETRLRDFFTKAKNVTEMLAIERELGRVRGEIESLAAQVSLLERQAAMATVTIELSQPEPVVQPAGFDWGVRTALTQGIRAMVATFNGIIVNVLGSLPVLVLLGLAVWVVLALVKRSRTPRSPEGGDAEAEA